MQCLDQFLGGEGDWRVWNALSENPLELNLVDTDSSLRAWNYYFECFEAVVWFISLGHSSCFPQLVHN